MKSTFCIIFVVILLTTGCNDNNSYQYDKQLEKRSESKSQKSLPVSADTMIQGDIFTTSGPAGSMDQKQGKVLFISDSGAALPIIMKDNKIMALELTGNGIYRVNKGGDHVSYSLLDSNNVIGHGRMMMLTDDGNLLNVKLLGNNMVVLTKNNIMIPLDKK